MEDGQGQMTENDCFLFRYKNIFLKEHLLDFHLT